MVDTELNCTNKDTSQSISQSEFFDVAKIAIAITKTTVT